MLDEFVDIYPALIPAISLQHGDEDAFDFESKGTTTSTFETVKQFYLDVYETLGNLMVIPVAFNNIHYIIRKHEGRECAQKAVEVLNANFSMVSLTQVVMGKAIQSKWPDFEDAIQFFSALSISADFIITRNIKDFPSDVLPISTPEIFLAHYSEMI